MLLNEVAKKTGMTKRAIKYYEEQNLLSVQKNSNGYRNYTAENIDTLKRISVYRKLGISIKDIRQLLNHSDKNILLKIYREKLKNKEMLDIELDTFKHFIEEDNPSNADDLLDYRTILNAIESLLPGQWNYFFKSHFEPFLHIPIRTDVQKQALKNLLAYCDDTTIKIPFLMKLSLKLYAVTPHKSKTAEEMISFYRDMSESDYERLKSNVIHGVKLKTGWLKYHPSFISQRRMQKELQNKGYHDIFIPNLKRLSPKYDEYKKYLDCINDRICQELGLYYDSDYNLVLRNKNLK